MKKFLSYVLGIFLFISVFSIRVFAANNVSSLTELETAINSNETDITLSADITISSDTTLNLNGKTINTNGYKFIASGSSLTVEGGTIENNVAQDTTVGNNDSPRRPVFSGENGSSITLNSVTINTKSSPAIKSLGTVNH